ncbi:hypothetical protein AHAS_Ahas11G0344700 [Arachis hypogaea]
MVIFSYIKNVEEACKIFNLYGMRSTRIEAHIRRILPPLGWVKVNSDGAAENNQGKTSCGGIIRDSHRRWIAGYKANLGYCIAYRAEL